MGSFRQNRDKIDFYNKNTQILKEMVEMREGESELAKDMMSKRVMKKKRANIRKDGPDAPGLASYRKTNAIVESMGAEYMGSEIPEDSIQVDVFTISNGGKDMKKSRFYTRAEAP